MKEYTVTDGRTRYTRITKRAAKKLFEQGKSFYIIAHKMRPGFPFSMGMTIHPENPNSETFEYFDHIIASFAYYNCSNETGYYPAFYLESVK